MQKDGKEIQKRERWRKGLVLSQHQIMELAKARKEAKSCNDDDFDRRLRGIELVGKKFYTQESAGTFLEVTESAVTQWVMAYKKGGIDALRGTKAKGAISRLSEDELEILKELVKQGPEACGIDCGVWNCALVHKLVLREFNVDYSLSQIRRILIKMGFSVQYPKKVLSEANKQAQKTWLEETYPAIKKSKK